MYTAVDPGLSFVDQSNAISVGFLYKISSVTLKGVPKILDDTSVRALDDASIEFPVFDGPNTNRASLAASLETRTGDCITIANNHFKSKGGDGDGMNADLGDGAGNWNHRRLQAARAVAAWLEADPTAGECTSTAIVVDLNAYAMEDPIQYLVQEAGYVNVKSPREYSYIFDGQLGTLDYILMSLNVNVVHAAVWHISEDDDALDYNLDFGRSADYFDASSPARPSDHSPVLVGLDLSKSGSTTTTTTPTREGSGARRSKTALFVLAMLVAAMLEVFINA